ncbi:C45 family autoproteolytic acyltransferase/hydolase [Glycomyces algeriensis]|uniref:Peptidase C45 n=1 Tax=Glycomyces algeriensis TaxID=256037 RepID=A0A9W6GC83_9ACTN|nr:C45 family peptidase [Glycomyces algeriensis]MDA1365737.1 C45 family autoproteolytic acyltransferase/hydrolase [Glycomyces algeriensis]MDR7351426.1 isopenicillin-N N-acyltransferase-like protein [Glycomyces algeriensis]GLI44147.1 peptidase C45 [Glycomyces algeriensis]
MTSLPLLHLQGSPHHRGLQHGEELREAIAANVAVYRSRMLTSGVPENELASRSQRFLEQFTRYDASYRETMDGIAEGSGQDLLDITLLNARYELLYSAWSEFGRPTADGIRSECTSFGGADGAFVASGTQIGQNWDWFTGVEGALLQWEHGDTTVIGFTEAGVAGAKIGLNSAGIGLCINGLGASIDDWRLDTVPFHLRTMRVLQSTSLAEAVGHAVAPRPACSSNFFIGSAAEGVLTVEASPVGSRVIYQEGTAPLVHANHFRDPEALGVHQSWLETGRVSTYHRCDRMETLLAKESPVSAERLHAAMRDHEGGPLGLCRHPVATDPVELQTHTALAAHLELDAKRFSYTWGPPCESEFATVSL